MRTGLFLFSAAAIAALTFSCKTAEPTADDSSTKRVSIDQGGMEYVTACDRKHVCRKFSRLIMGTDHLAQSDWTNDGQKEPTDAEVFAVLDEAAKLGINLFDTSPIYVGGVENRLGKWIKSRKPSIASSQFYYNKDLNPDRKLYTLSKGGFPFDLFYSKKLESGTHSNALKQALTNMSVLDMSLSPAADGSIALNNVPPGTYASRLYGSQDQIESRVAEELGHTDNNLDSDLTIYLMHRDDNDYVQFKEVAREQTPVLTIMKALSSPQLASKYELIGWSNWQTDRVNESVKLGATTANLIRPSFNSAYFSLFEMSSRSIHAGGIQVTHAEMMDQQFQRGIFQNPYSPLGGFSVLDKPEPRWENAKKSAKAKYDAGDAYWQNVYYAIFTDANEARFKRAEQFTKYFNLAHHTNYTIDQTINAYALAHNRTDFLTVGPINVMELRRTVGALKLARMLTPKDLDYLYKGN